MKAPSFKFKLSKEWEENILYKYTFLPVFIKRINCEIFQFFIIILLFIVLYVKIFPKNCFKMKMPPFIRMEVVQTFISHAGVLGCQGGSAAAFCNPWCEGHTGPEQGHLNLLTYLLLYVEHILISFQITLISFDNKYLWEKNGNLFPPSQSH